jgi:phosphatidylserine/phosphatidylglycerophosphate/cardiolipin synthase-like enzyme
MIILKGGKEKQIMRSFWKVSAIFLILLTGCSTVPLPPKVTDPVIHEDLKVYFTGSGHDPEEIIDAVVNSIDGAKQSVDMAMYNINLPEVEQALIHAFQRGVWVRLVMESDALDGKVPRSLIAKGITIVGDGKESLMHNKFIVIDNQQVWTGSLNLTDNGVTEDRNNFIRIDSTKVAERYTQEFEEMFGEKKFGSGSPSGNDAVNIIEVAGTAMSIYFSPDDNVMQKILNIVNDAGERIDFLAYSFTYDSLAKAMIQNAQQGVRVQGVFDSDMVASNTGTDYEWLVSTGLPVCLDGETGLMHDKVIVVDEEIVITGSYNFTNNAEKYNDENIVILHDPTLARLYLDEIKLITNNCTH